MSRSDQSQFYIPCLCGQEAKSHERETQCPHCGRLLVVEWGNDPVEVVERNEEDR